MEIKELFESKAYVKSGITFPTPETLLNPIVDKLSKLTDKLVIKTSEKVINANEDGSANIAFGRVSLQTDFSKEEISGMYKNIGLVYSLDSQKPIIKVYTGSIVSSCTNLCVFYAEHLNTFNVLDGMEKPINCIKGYISDMERLFEEYQYTKQKLERQFLNKQDVNNLLGNLLEYSIKNKHLGTTVVVNAAKELYDNTSKYYFTDDTTAWNVFNSLTQYITDKADILDKPSKTLILSKFFLN